MMNDIGGRLLQGEWKPVEDLSEMPRLAGVVFRGGPFSLGAVKEELGRFVQRKGTKRLFPNPDRPVLSASRDQDMTSLKLREDLSDSSGRFLGIHVIQNQQPAGVIAEPAQDGIDCLRLRLGLILR